MRQLLWGTLLCCAVCHSSNRCLASRIIDETEPNNSKGGATPAPLLLTGDAIRGHATAGDVDYWRIATAPAQLGIYRHTLTLESPFNPGGTLGGTAGVNSSLRGVSQSRGVITETEEVSVQDSATASARFGGTTLITQWYGFGKSEQLFYAINNTADGDPTYQATLQTATVTPIDAGTYQRGAITLSSVAAGHGNDTEMWVYNGNFELLGGNDNATPGHTDPEPSRITHDFNTPGIYYVAISEYDLAVRGIHDVNDGGFDRLQRTPDFDNIILEGGPHGATPLLNVSMVITDSTGMPHTVTMLREHQLDVIFARLTVVPEPAAAVVAALILVALRRRRPVLPGSGL